MEDSNLEEKVSNVIKSAGIKISGVYCWGLADKTKTANAAFVGIGRTKRIVLSDTLLDNYSDNDEYTNNSNNEDNMNNQNPNSGSKIINPFTFFKLVSRKSTSESIILNLPDIIGLSTVPLIEKV